MRTSCLTITVVAMAIGLSAPARGVSQDKIPLLPIQRPAVAATATVTGCVAQGATIDTHVLTHATREVEGMALGTATPVTLVLSGTDVVLSNHVGHKVSLTGWDVAAKGPNSATGRASPPLKPWPRRPARTCAASSTSNR